MSQEFSGTETCILGALARLDDFLVNPLIQGHSGTAPETSRNALSTSQGTNEDDSQSDPHPEADIFHNQTTQNSGPEDGYDSISFWLVNPPCPGEFIVHDLKPEKFTNRQRVVLILLKMFTHYTIKKHQVVEFAPAAGKCYAHELEKKVARESLRLVIFRCFRFFTQKLLGIKTSQEYLTNFKIISKPTEEILQFGVSFPEHKDDFMESRNLRFEVFMKS